MYSNQDMEATEVFINRGMDKEDAVHTHTHTHTHTHRGISLSIKRDEIMPSAAT